jgi:hypothetical protein
MKQKVFPVVAVIAMSAALANPIYGLQPFFQADSGSSSAQAAGGWPSPEDVVSKMDKKLSLSDDQKSKITPIIADRQTQMKALMADTSGRRLQKARKAKSIMSDSDSKIMAVLNDQQKKEYTEMKQEMREQMQERRQQRGGGMAQ